MPSLLAFAFVFLPAAAAFAAEAPATDAAGSDLQIVAAAVRARGLPCDRPQAAERDPQASRADRPAWLLRCAEGRYRVVYEGDTGAQVMPLR